MLLLSFASVIATPGGPAATVQPPGCLSAMRIPVKPLKQLVLPSGPASGDELIYTTWMKIGVSEDTTGAIVLGTCSTIQTSIQIWHGFNCSMLRLIAGSGDANSPPDHTCVGSYPTPPQATAVVFVPKYFDYTVNDVFAVVSSWPHELRGMPSEDPLIDFSLQNLQTIVPNEHIELICPSSLWTFGTFLCISFLCTLLCYIIGRVLIDIDADGVIGLRLSFLLNLVEAILGSPRKGKQVPALPTERGQTKRDATTRTDLRERHDLEGGRSRVDGSLEQSARAARSGKTCWLRCVAFWQKRPCLTRMFTQNLNLMPKLPNSYLRVLRLQTAMEGVTKAVVISSVADPLVTCLCGRRPSRRPLIHNLLARSDEAIEEVATWAASTEQRFIDKALITALYKVRDATIAALEEQLLLADRELFRPAQFVSVLVHAVLNEEALKHEVGRQVREATAAREASAQAAAAELSEAAGCLCGCCAAGWRLCCWRLCCSLRALSACVLRWRVSSSTRAARRSATSPPHPWSAL